ncbi:adenylosuccinate lyase, partial [Clostridium botulinum]|nr:adenylosuccinate lyase [Clostridium botulinum]
YEFYNFNFIKNDINIFNNKKQGIIGGESYVRYIP